MCLKKVGGKVTDENVNINLELLCWLSQETEKMHFLKTIKYGDKDYRLKNKERKTQREGKRHRERERGGGWF